MKHIRLIFQWEENPLLPMLVFCCAGVVAFDYHFIPEGFFFAGLAFWLAGRLLLLPRMGEVLKAWSPIVRTLLTWLLYFWIGTGLARLQKREEAPEHITAFSCTVLESYGLQDDGKLRCLATADAGKMGRCWHPINRKVLLQFRDCKEDLGCGKRLLVSKPLERIPHPGIPGQFDAAVFYRRQGIDYQIFLSPAETQPLFPDRPMNLRFFSQACRKFLENTLAKNLKNPDDGYMLSALLLGIRRKIDPELKAAYSAAGVTHILAVSGMHVGLIFGCLVFVLGRIRRWSAGAWVFSALIIALLWFYALITGLSPSVLRAVTVFSVMQLSDLLRKPPLAINGLCFASLILLCADVQLVYDVGYQLSFAAVYGIVSFERPIRDLWKPKPFLMRKIWEGSTITVAATLSTFPVIVYYFHQFPVYFLIANLVAVPVSNGLIYGGIALLLLSPIPILATGAGWLIHLCIGFLNGFVLFIQRLPMSSIADLYVPGYALVSLFVALIFFNLRLRFPGTVSFRWTFVFLLFCTSGTMVYNLHLWNSDPKVFVIRTKKEWMLGRRTGRMAHLNLISGQGNKDSSSFEVKALKEGFHVLKVWSHSDSGTRVSQDPRHPDRQSRLVVKNGKRLFLLGNYLKWQKKEEKILVDALVLVNGGMKSLEQALCFVAPREIWVDWNSRQENSWKNYHPESVLVNYRIRRYREL